MSELSRSDINLSKRDKEILEKRAEEDDLFGKILREFLALEGKDDR